MGQNGATWTRVRWFHKAFRLHNPFAEKRKGEVSNATMRLELSRFRGETLMREFLTLLIDSDEYDDNARPGFLVNPLTGMQLEYDRYYLAGVAFEFNGPQHYGVTEKYQNEQEVREQQARDLIKLGISVLRGIRVVIIHPEDLCLETMRKKVQGLGLPLKRDLSGHGPLIDFLETASEDYRNRVYAGT